MRKQWGKMPHNGQNVISRDPNQVLERKIGERESLAKLIVPDMDRPMPEEDDPEPGSFDGPQSIEDYGYLPPKEK